MREDRVGERRRDKMRVAAYLIFGNKGLNLFCILSLHPVSLATRVRKLAGQGLCSFIT